MHFLYREPAAPAILSGLGEGELATARGRWLPEMSKIGARNMAQGQRDGEIPADRDPEYLAAATIDQLWSFVSGAVGLNSEGREDD